MPLKLKDIQDASSTSLINKWADEKDQQILLLTQRIKVLETKLTK